jgi:prepilin-type N-terminal cleavage/methylation domain-containing protein
MFKKQNGFSLIEMLVSMSILAILMTVGFGFIFASISGAEKSEATKLVRENGNYALSVMEGILRTAKNVNCPLGVGDTSINVVAQDGNSTIFSQVGNRIASGSAGMVNAYLTSGKVVISSLGFICTTISGKPVTVEINFSVYHQSTVNPRASEKFQMDFNDKVIIRNDVN